MRSKAWVRMKPSMQTITGQESDLGQPEGLDVQVGRLLVGFGMNSWIQPASFIAMLSVWSFQMLIGAPIARLPTVMTIGRPRPAAL